MGDVIQIGLTRTTKPDISEDQLFASDEALIRVDPPEYVWTCSLCACQCFQLLASGITSCVRCGHRSGDASGDTSSAWRSHLPELPLTLEDIPPIDHTNTIIDQKPQALIMQGFIKGIKTEDPVALLLIRRDGSMRMWCEGVHNDEQEVWFKERLDRVCEYVLERRSEEEPDGG